MVSDGLGCPGWSGLLPGHVASQSVRKPPCVQQANKLLAWNHRYSNGSRCPSSVLVRDPHVSTLTSDGSLTNFLSRMSCKDAETSRVAVKLVLAGAFHTQRNGEAALTVTCSSLAETALKMLGAPALVEHIPKWHCSAELSPAYCHWIPWVLHKALLSWLLLTESDFLRCYHTNALAATGRLMSKYTTSHLGCILEHPW